MITRIREGKDSNPGHGRKNRNRRLGRPRFPVIKRQVQLEMLGHDGPWTTTDMEFSDVFQRPQSTIPTDSDPPLMKPPSWPIYGLSPRFARLALRLHARAAQPPVAGGTKRWTSRQRARKHLATGHLQGAGTSGRRGVTVRSVQPPVTPTELVLVRVGGGGRSSQGGRAIHRSGAHPVTVKLVEPVDGLREGCQRRTTRFSEESSGEEGFLEIHFLELLKEMFNCCLLVLLVDS